MKFILILCERKRIKQKYSFIFLFLIRLIDVNVAHRRNCNNNAKKKVIKIGNIYLTISCTNLKTAKRIYIKKVIKKTLLQYAFI